MKNSCPGRGRGVVAVRDFAEGEVVVDYHAKSISEDEFNMISETEEENDRRSDYLFCLPEHNIYLDASAENCECHPCTRLIGRLINWAKFSSDRCNLVQRFFKCDGKTEVLLVAKRQISCLEELFYDYGDPACAEMFGFTGAGSN